MLVGSLASVIEMETCLFSVLRMFVLVSTRELSSGAYSPVVTYSVMYFLFVFGVKCSFPV